jgi:hypothetical protein
MIRRYKKVYKSPHEKLHKSLSVLLALALSIKRRLLLTYVADNGTSGLLDYADTVLDSGWDQYFPRVADILSAAAHTSTIETLDETGQEHSDELVTNLEKHNQDIANNAAAYILGLSYDHTLELAVPTIAGWSIGQAILEQLGRTLILADTEAWSSVQLDQAIGDLSQLSSKRAGLMAGNALSLVEGQAARNVAAATGAVEKKSETVHDDKVCPECIQNEADGWIGVNDLFSGSETEDTPHHPFCRCSVEYSWNPISTQVQTV